ncbi:MAG: ABC transporter permease, partial [Caulobacteraceae bacterium]
MIAWPLPAGGLPLAESVAEAFANLFAQRQRSALALLGILIGTASIVAMLTIGHMAQLETLKLFRHLGVDMLQIHAMPAGNSLAGVLDRGAIERLPASEPAVLAATPLVADRDTVSAGAIATELPIAAVTAGLRRLVAVAIDQGRFLEPIADGSLVAVGGGPAAQQIPAPRASTIPGAQ